MCEEQDALRVKRNKIGSRLYADDVMMWMDNGMRMEILIKLSKYTHRKTF